jgi:hypothetical protein
MLCNSLSDRVMASISFIIVSLLSNCFWYLLVSLQFLHQLYHDVELFHRQASQLTHWPICVSLILSVRPAVQSI